MTSSARDGAEGCHDGVHTRLSSDQEGTATSTVRSERRLTEARNRLLRGHPLDGEVGMACGRGLLAVGPKGSCFHPIHIRQGVLPHSIHGCDVIKLEYLAAHGCEDGGNVCFSKHLVMFRTGEYG